MTTPHLISYALIAAVCHVTAGDDPRINQLQFIGTHNSYHLAPSPKVRGLIDTFAKGEGASLDHTHRSLTEQLEALHVRQIELDLFADPQGGLFADPLAAHLANEVNRTPDPELKKPGFKILHSPDFDYQTTVPTLRKALRELAVWSKEHPGHEPVMVLLELKEKSFSPRIRPLPFDAVQLQALEAEIREELPTEKILTPDRVRGDSLTLREAVTRHGWPRLSEAAGTFIFALDNGEPVRERYLALNKENNLHGRVAFVSLPRDHPAAAWMKLNNPVSSFDDIRALVKEGFMVRTRADDSLKEVRAKDLSRFKKAVASGAQWISTDAPEELPNLPGYHVSWETGRVWQTNPVKPDHAE